ncbi:MAG: universal stress protein [Lapillicoccus sp.]
MSVDALRYAFAATSQRHLPLEVVTSWDPALLATYRLEGTVAVEVLAAAGNRHLGTALAAVASGREKYPDVTVHVRVGTDAPAEALFERSDGAALTVVGSRG